MDNNDVVNSCATLGKCDGSCDTSEECACSCAISSEKDEPYKKDDEKDDKPDDEKDDEKDEKEKEKEKEKEIISAKAQEIINNTTKEDIEGLKNLQNYSLSIGLPAVRGLFQIMIEESVLQDGDKQKMFHQVSNFSPITEVGCTEIQFYNTETKLISTAHILLDRCPHNYDFGVNLEKLKKCISLEGMEKINYNMSMMIQTARALYRKIAKDHINLICYINGLKNNDPCLEFLDTKVDFANTTLYLQKFPITDRIGIKIYIT